MNEKKQKNTTTQSCISIVISAKVFFLSLMSTILEVDKFDSNANMVAKRSGQKNNIPLTIFVTNL
jgi:hypothetical protein